MLKRNFINALKLGATCALIPILFSSCACYFWGIHCGEDAGEKDLNTLNWIMSQSTAQNHDSITPDGVALPSNVKQKKMPKPKGVLSNIEVGPSVNFKSAQEEYGGYSKHKPGIGFQFYMGSYWSGLGKDLYLHPAIGFKQSRAFEELDYGLGDGTPSILRKDEYVYNFLSMPILLEHRGFHEDLGLFAGPEFNYLLGSSFKSAEQEKQKTTGQSVRAGLGMQVGANYRIHRRSNRAPRTRLTILYDRRFSQLNKNQPGMTPAVWRMSALQLKFVYDICGCN